MAWYQDEPSATLFPSLNHDQTKPYKMCVGALTSARLALDLNEISLHPSHTIVTFSSVGWLLDIDAAWFQDEPFAAIMSSLNHDQTKPDAMWIGAATRACLVMDRNK